MPPRASHGRQALRLLLAAVMVSAGVLHFARPAGFVKIVPSFLPAPLLLVWLSGACEVLFGLGLLFRRTRRLASFGLIALLVAVFPANVNMAVSHIQPEGTQIPVFLLWLRLPMQGLLILWAWWVGRDAVSPPPRPLAR